MNRFGKYQRYASSDLQRLGALGRIYSSVVGFTQVPSYGRFLWMRKALRHMRQRPTSILDAGCGCGEYAFYFAERYPQAKVKGIDIDPDAVKKCERVRSKIGIKNLAFAVEDLTALSEHKVWDFIYSVDVLEHVPENRRVLAQFYSALKPGGYLYVRIPAPHQDRILPKGLIRSHEEWAEEEHVAQHFDIDTLLAHLKSCGFEIVYAARTNGFFGKLAFEIGHVLDERWRVGYALAVPCLKTLYWLDVLGGPKYVGNGLIVLSRRSNV